MSLSPDSTQLVYGVTRFTKTNFIIVKSLFVDN